MPRLRKSIRRPGSGIALQRARMAARARPKPGTRVPPLDSLLAILERPISDEQRADAERVCFGALPIRQPSLI